MNVACRFIMGLVGYVMMVACFDLFGIKVTVCFLGALLCALSERLGQHENKHNPG